MDQDLRMNYIFLGYLFAAGIADNEYRVGGHRDAGGFGGDGSVRRFRFWVSDRLRLALISFFKVTFCCTVVQTRSNLLTLLQTILQTT